MNYIFQHKGVYKTKGWCFLEKDNKETWGIESIDITYTVSKGLLKLHFFCYATNSLGIARDKIHYYVR